VTPGAKTNRILDTNAQGQLQICIAAKPADNAANKLLCSFLAEKLRLPKSSVRIFRGQTSRQKVVEIVGLSLQQVLAAITPEDE
jgi:hypothetical protein